MNQTLQSWEWIIVDDCSTDPVSIKLLEEITNTDRRVRVIRRNLNGGPASARNTGAHEVRSDLIFFLDADDLIEPTTLEKCAWYLNSREDLAFVKGFSVGFGASEYLWRQGFHSGRRNLHENLVTVTTMVRRAAFEDIGGFDEALTAGLEDWEFWIRGASKGYWGDTIPEFLDWYRRRSSHTETWSQWDGSLGEEAFRKDLSRKYASLYSGTDSMCRPAPPHYPFASIRDRPLLQNDLAQSNPRILLVLPWLRMGGSDKWNLDLVKQLVERNWDVCIATTIDGTLSWAHEFSKYTSDIHALRNFVRDEDVPVYLRYLIETRKPEVVMISNSWLCYHFLPYLRSVCPDPAYVDYNHMEEDHWQSGGHPRRGVGMQDQLDLNIVSSQHLKDWMVSRGAQPDRIGVAYTNADPELWKPNPSVRQRVRAELSLADDEPAILFAGRICEQKQPRVLAGTIRQLAKDGHRFKAIIAGSGEDGPWLRAYIEEYKLGSHVQMLGEVSSERVRELMSAVDIYFLPSQWEGIAISVYEAMSMGLAVVGAIVGGQAELVTPDVGILLPKSDEETEISAYAEAIGSLLSSPDEIAKLGTAARAKIVSSHTLDAMGDRMIELFDRAKNLSQEQPRERLSTGLAHELAVQAVEFFRLQRVGDELWNTREKSAKERSKLSAELHKLRNGTASPPSAQAALVEISEIESSKAWRAVQGMKRTPVYSLVGRARYGPHWSLIDPNENPEARLSRIKNSNAYRFITKVKRTRAYRIYGKRKHQNVMV